MALIKNQKSTVTPQDERQISRDFPGLSTIIATGDARARRWAARDLVAFDGASEVLVSRLALETDPGVREAILLALTEIGDQDAIDGLVMCLGCEDVQLRNEAIGAMKHLPDQVAPIMETLLNNTDPDIRIFSVNVLESLRHPQVVPWLVKVIEQDPHVNVCATAVDLLGEVGNESAVTALHRLNERFPAEPYIQFAVSLALKRIEEV